MLEPITKAEHDLVTEWKEKKAKVPPHIKFKQRKEEVVPALQLLGGGHSDPEYRYFADPDIGKDLQSSDSFLATISKTTGTLNETFGVHLLLQTLGASPHAKEICQVAESVSAALVEMAPKDAIKGMIVSQLVALYHQIMKFMQNSLNENAFEQVVDLNINRFTKLNVRFLHTLEILLKYRRRSEQTLHVENLTINNDGKAVIGNFKTAP